MNNKKAQLGLETAKTIILVLLVLGIIAVALFLALSSMLPVIRNIDTQSGSATNESMGTVVNASSTDLAVVNSYQGLDCSITRITLNNGTVLSLTTYPQTTASDGSDCAIDTTSLSGAGFNNTVWNATYTYTRYGDDAVNSENVNNNITTGVVQFMSYIPTIFTILAIVVIILAIALILFAVNRFSGGEIGL